MIRRTVLAVAVLSGFAAAAWSQPARADEPRRKFSSLLNVDALIDNYARFLSRKYDLNEHQDGFTHELLKKKARVFLDQHENELKDLVDRMFDVRTGAEMSPDELVSWGQRIAPIYAEAKRVIVDGNHEWRTVLNPEQLKMHDADLALMEQSFAMTDDQLGRIVSGQMTVEEFRNPGRRRQEQQQPPPPPVQQPQPEYSQEQIDAETAAKEAADRAAQAQAAMEAKLAEEKLAREREAAGDDAPPMEIPPDVPSSEHAAPEKPHVVVPPPPPPHVQPPHTPPPGATPPAPPPNPTAQRIRNKVAAAAGGQNPSEWENYVKQFIERYKLNPEQTEKANQVLKACQDQAESPRRTAERRAADLDQKIAGLQGSKDPGAAAQIQKLNEEKAKLSEPIKRIFEQSLKPRLERIPTQAQRRAAEAAGNRGAAAPVPPGSATTNAPPKPRRTAKPAPPAPIGESSEDSATPTGKKRPDDE